MVMNEYEIYRSFKEAKNQNLQISILADLNDCKRKDISKIINRQQNLDKHREELSKNVEFTQCEGDFEELEARLDFLDAIITKYTNEYRMLSKVLGAKNEKRKVPVYQS